MNLALLLNLQGARKRVLYEQSAAQPSLPAEVSNIDLNFVPSVAFISDVYIANSLRARTLINLSAVLYEQAAARTSLPAEVSNIDLNFVPSVAFIPNVHIADSLRTRTLINPSAVLYEQAAARTGLPAKADAQSSLSAEVGIIDLNFVPSNADCVNNNNNNVAPTPQFSPTALLNPRSLALKRPASSDSDLNRGRTNSTIAIGDNIEELICVSKVKHTYVQAHTVPYPNLKKYLGNSSQQGRIKVSFCQAGNNRNNLNIIVTNLTSREFGRVDMKSLTRLSWTDIRRKQAGEGPLGSPFSGLIRPTPRELGSIYVLRIVSKSDKVPTQELSSHIKTELYPLRDNSYKFYRLVITSEDTHCKQIIKKAYIISLERASLILFIT
ncbi:hypothetical protein HBI22_053120 [Parastagonospora nodorum]|nr:hypothetical protein HBI28_041930 [Parastagonospora nodorum]KAH5642150.1 hypothetical protein HBI22_053120 [Parastagonospora nodorum]